MGWRIRHGVDLGTTGVLLAGAALATVVHLVVDVALHRHRTNGGKS